MGDSTYVVSGSTFKTYPTTLTAYQGNTNACGLLGTSSTTVSTYYWVEFTKTETTAVYTALPYLKVFVSTGTTTITVPSTAKCALGGSSIPIVVTNTAAPYTSVTLKLEATSYNTSDTTAKNPSENVTAGATVLTFTTVSTSGVLTFTCGASLSATLSPTLNYTIGGTDKASYTSIDKVTVTG